MEVDIKSQTEARFNPINLEAATMTDIYEWLGNVNQPYGMPHTPFLEPGDRMLDDDDPMEPITLCDVDTAGNTYFDMSIDPSLYDMTGPSAPTTSSQTFVMVPEEFAEASGKILVYLAQVLEVPEVMEESDKEEAIPKNINGIPVNLDPQPEEIKEIIDLTRIGHDRHTYYLGKSIHGKYYWFHSPYAARGRHLRQLIGDYRHKSSMEMDEKPTCDVKKKLRSGRSRT